MNEAIPSRKADRGRTCCPGAVVLHQSRAYTGPSGWARQVKGGEAHSNRDLQGASYCSNVIPRQSCKRKRFRPRPVRFLVTCLLALVTRLARPCDTEDNAFGGQTLDYAEPGRLKSAYCTRSHTFQVTQYLVFPTSPASYLGDSAALCVSPPQADSSGRQLRAPSFFTQIFDE